MNWTRREMLVAGAGTLAGLTFNDDGMLTAAYTNGQNINHKGITPDKVIKISDADAKAGNDTQLQAAQAYLNK